MKRGMIELKKLVNIILILILAGIGLAALGILFKNLLT